VEGRVPAEARQQVADRRIPDRQAQARAHVAEGVRLAVLTAFEMRLDV
jgi:hypothetical protein